MKSPPKAPPSYPTSVIFDPQECRASQMRNVAGKNVVPTSYPQRKIHLARTAYCFSFTTFKKARSCRPSSTKFRHHGSLLSLCPIASHVFIDSIVTHSCLDTFNSSTSKHRRTFIAPAALFHHESLIFRVGAFTSRLTYLSFR